MSSLSLHTSLPPSSSPSSPSRSPLSSATTSPTSICSSPPTSPFRRFRPWKGNNTKSSSGHLPPLPTTISGTTTTTTTTNNASPPTTTTTTTATTSEQLRSALGQLLLLRRRPSKVDLALSEERARCDTDIIERKGLGMLEPRPVSAAGLGFGAGDLDEGGDYGQPRFVMGGISEVLEGRA